MSNWPEDAAPGPDQHDEFGFHRRVARQVALELRDVRDVLVGAVGHRGPADSLPHRDPGVIGRGPPRSCGATAPPPPRRAGRRPTQLKRSSTRYRVLTVYRRRASDRCPSSLISCSSRITARASTMNSRGLGGDVRVGGVSAQWNVNRVSPSIRAAAEDARGVDPLSPAVEVRTLAEPGPRPRQAVPPRGRGRRRPPSRWANACTGSAPTPGRWALRRGPR